MKWMSSSKLLPNLQQNLPNRSFPRNARVKSSSGNLSRRGQKREGRRRNREIWKKQSKRENSSLLDINTLDLRRREERGKKAVKVKKKRRKSSGKQKKERRINH